MTSAAIMQPYFLPYAGYFRLLAASDLFVIYDCVQFPRRGWVHRNRLTDRSGELRWLTLPLAKASRDVLIRDLQFQTDADLLMMERLAPFQLDFGSPAVRDLTDMLRTPQGTPLDFIEALLGRVAGYLGLPWNVIRSSSLDVPQELRGQERILEIARRVGAERYVNPSGGRALYEAEAFSRAGVELRFLPEYQGSLASILDRMLREPADELAADIARQSQAAP